MGTYVGKPVARIDALEKVTGQAVYCGDIELPGMLFGATLRSPLAHARIERVDVSAARRVGGVRAVVTAREFPYIFGTMIKDQPFLAAGRVRYVGEPIVAVAAESEAAAQEAVGRIVVDYTELPAVFDLKDAIAEGAPVIHADMASYGGASFYHCVPGTNICTVREYAQGDIAAGFAASDAVFEDEFHVQAVAHTPLETHAAIAKFSATDNGLTLWSPTDGPHRRVKEISDALGIPVSRIRLLSAYSGGGFGGKGNLVAEAIAIALARFTRGRPVKVVFSREEELCASQTRLAAAIRLKTGVKKDGSLVARSADLIWDNGAYSSKAPDVAVRGALTIFGPYRIPHIRLLSRLVYTNNEISGAFRGYGTTQVTMACESQMDMIAGKLGIDPLEIRCKNGYVEGDAYINGQILHGVGLRDTLEQAARTIGWGKPLDPPQGSRFRGRGLATTIKGTATPTNSCCFIKVHQDGSVNVVCSSVEIGAGQQTVIAQIAADTIGVPLEAVSVPHSDTFISPYDFGVTSSRTTFHMGNAVRLAGQKARRKILELAARVLERPLADLDLAEGNIVIAKGAGSIPLKELMARKYGGRGGTIIAQGNYSPEDSALLAASGQQKMSSIFWKFATHAVEVEVDTETGIVKILKVVAAHDVGRAINPLGCEQQIQGAVVMGISTALFEEFKRENGRVLNDTLADYKLATIQDLPRIVPLLIESTHREAPYGAKGIGEPAAAPTAPAIANAIYDAVGVRITHLPITPEKILAALQQRKP